MQLGDGESLALASVLVFQYVYRQGQRELVPRGADRSDDRGQYRVFGLEPGEYFVSAQVPRSFTVEEGRGRQGTPPFAAGGGLWGLAGSGVDSAGRAAWMMNKPSQSAMRLPITRA